MQYVCVAAIGEVVTIGVYKRPRAPVIFAMVCEWPDSVAELARVSLADYQELIGFTCSVDLAVAAVKCAAADLVGKYHVVGDYRVAPWCIPVRKSDPLEAAPQADL